MNRKAVLRQAVSVAVCVWTVLLLVLRFSPGFVQTQTLRSDDGARSYTVPAMQEITQAQTQLQEEAVKSAAQTEPATVLQTSEPTVVTDPYSEKATEAPQTQQAQLHTQHSQQTQPKPDKSQAQSQKLQTQAQHTKIEPQTSAAATENEVQPDLPSQRLPVVPNTEIDDVRAETTMRPLRFGAEVTTALPGEGLGVVYILTVTERGSIQYTLGYPSNGPFTDIGWKLTLYEEYDRLGNSGSTDYRLLNILTSSVATQSVTSAFIGVQPGVYRLVLEQSGAFSRDDVTVLADFTAEVDREIEPNDTPARFTELYPGYAMKGSSNKYETSTETDEDWYLFRMPYDGYANYTLIHEAMDMISVSWQIYLYDAALNQLSFNNADFSEGSITGEQVGLGEGLYFICVKGRVHSTQDYAIKVDTVEAVLFEQESNDTFETATPVSAGAVFNGMMNNRSQGIDYDYYAVTLTKPGSLKIIFRHAAIDEDEDGEVYIGWNISLFNAEGEKLYSGSSDWKDTVNLSPEMGVAAGTYYVCIDSDNRYFSPEPYTVQIEHASDRSFEAEPNNTSDKASQAVFGNAVKGSLTQAGLETDCDWFVYSIASDMDVRLTFSHEKVNLDRLGWIVTLTDVDGNVYTPMDEKGLPFTDAAGAVINQVPVNWNQSDATACFRLKAGDYYVRIDAGDYFSSETYSLLLQKK